MTKRPDSLRPPFNTTAALLPRHLWTLRLPRAQPSTAASDAAFAALVLPPLVAARAPNVIDFSRHRRR